MKTNILFKAVGLLLAIITPLVTILLTDVTVPFDKEINGPGVNNTIKIEEME